MNLESIINILNDEVKLKEHESWDNSGLQVGSDKACINKIMLTMDLGREALDLALREKVDLIITHHPFFFSPIKRIDTDTYDGQIIKMLIKENINLYSIHTSYDMADKGVTSSLAEKLNIVNYQILHPVNEDKSGYGGIGDIPPIDIIEYAQFVKKALEQELFIEGHFLVTKGYCFRHPFIGRGKPPHFVEFPVVGQICFWNKTKYLPFLQDYGAVKKLAVCPYRHSCSYQHI
jgi:dinuclear metal center YbgI/SA1388 family protein